jgi:hypothetical protein
VPTDPDSPARSGPAGWYQDPSGGRQLRWWDGSTWSDHVRPTWQATPAQQANNHLQDIRLLLAILVAMAFIAGYIALEISLDKKEREVDRASQEMRNVLP